MTEAWDGERDWLLPNEDFFESTPDQSGSSWPEGRMLEVCSTLLIMTNPFYIFYILRVASYSRAAFLQAVQRIEGKLDEFATRTADTLARISVRLERLEGSRCSIDTTIGTHEPTAHSSIAGRLCGGSVHAFTCLLPYRYESVFFILFHHRMYLL